MENKLQAIDYMHGANLTSDFEHFHRNYEIVLFERADFDIFIEDVRYHIAPHHLVLIDRYVLHKYLYTTMDYARYMLHMEEIAPSLSGKIFYAPCLVYSLSDRDYARLSTLFSVAAENFTADPRSVGMTHAIGLILWEIARLEYPPMLATGEGKNDALARDVIRYLNEAYMLPITLTDLSKRFYVDPYYLCRKFKGYCGYTIIQYLQYRRIKEAQNRLLEDRRIEEILPLCGFENIQHFYRVFKKIAGCTPEEWRRREK